MKKTATTFLTWTFCLCMIAFVNKTKAQEEYTTISGHVLEATMLPPYSGGYVSLYLVTPTGQYPLVDTAILGPEGGYTLNNVKNGRYLVKAVPLYSYYSMPTYYGDKEFWETADVVQVVGDPVVNVDIICTPIISSGGISSFSGYVFYDTDLKAKEPAEGVNVYLVKKSDIIKPVQGVTTGGDGKYMFGGLVPGEYYVKVDLPGFTTGKIDVEIKSDGEEVPVPEITIPKPPVLDIKTITNNSIITVFPNPTTGKLFVQSSMFKVQSVEIYDVMGKMQKSIKAEEQNVVIDISGFSNGIYFLKINNKTLKIIKQ